MSGTIEQILDQSKLRYTKEVDPAQGETYSVPFDSSAGPLAVRVCLIRDVFSASIFLRRLDSLAVKGTMKALLLELLRLNSLTTLARVFVYTSEEDETDWIAVGAEIPGPSPPVELATEAILEAARLSERVMETISDHTSVPEARYG